MTALLLFAKQYARVLAVLAVVASLLALYCWQLDKAEQRGYQRATSEMAERVAKANAATAALEQRQREQSDAAAAAWESQRNELQSRIDTLAARKPIVRLCRPAGRAAGVPSLSKPTPGSNDAALGAIDAVSMGPDVGPGVVRLAGECERYRTQLSALQNWLKSTSP